MNENTSIAQTKIGSRFNVIPGARIFATVTTKLTAPTVVEIPTNTTASPQKSRFTPGENVRSVSGVYANQPPSGACPETNPA